MRRLLALALGAAVLAAGPAGSQPAPANARQDPAQLASCLRKFAVVGAPRHRGDAAKAEQTGQVCRPGYALSFNGRTKSPDWVIERLNKKILSPPEPRTAAKRRDNFAQDPLIPDDPGKDDYGGARDRGHQAPAGDAPFDQARMDQSFFMSNMSPQQGPGFNRGQWKYLEEAVRHAIVCGEHEDVIVITGPVYGESNITIGKPGAPILVPDAYYKILYDVRQRRAVGFVLPNRKMRKTDLAKFVRPIQDIEDETGLDFFPALTQRAQLQLEKSKGVVWGHGHGCSGQSDD